MTLVRPWAVLAAVTALSYGQSPKAGEPAPPLVLEQTIPAGMNASWNALGSRPAVVEFWATWCATCIAEIPRLNELVSQFGDIQFISITDEPIAAVEPFLARQPVQGWIGLDRGGTTFKAYGVEARPRTVLVGRDGVVRAVMHPEQVDAGVLSDLAADRPVKPHGLQSRLDILQDMAADPVFALMLRPSSRRGGLFRLNQGRLEGNGILLKSILAYAYSVGERRVEGPAIPLNTRYDFCVSLPDGVAGDRELLREMLERSFKLKLRREPRDMDAVVLKLPAGKPPESAGVGQMAVLASMLESRLNRIAVNETGLESYRLFELPKNNEDLPATLRSHLGIELSIEHRPVEMLIVDSLELPAFRVTLPGR